MTPQITLTTPIQTILKPTDLDALIAADIAELQLIDTITIANRRAPVEAAKELIAEQSGITPDIALSLLHIVLGGLVTETRQPHLNRTQRDFLSQYLIESAHAYAYGYAPEGAPLPEALTDIMNDLEESIFLELSRIIAHFIAHNETWRTAISKQADLWQRAAIRPACRFAGAGID